MSALYAIRLQISHNCHRPEQTEMFATWWFIMRAVPLHEFHPLSDGEIAKIPQEAGIYLLFQIQIPVHVDAAENLRKAVRAAKTDFPSATHFAVETHWNADELAERKRQLEEQLRRVRKVGFTGSAP